MLNIKVYRERYVYIYLGNTWLEIWKSIANHIHWQSITNTPTDYYRLSINR